MQGENAGFTCVRVRVWHAHALSKQAQRAHDVHSRGN